MQCPKCNYEPTMAEMQSSPDQCPSCGVYYAKFGAALAASPARSRNVTFRDWASSNPVTLLVICLCLGFAAGYFAGREHVKYEIRSALQGAMGGFAEALAGGGARPQVKKAVIPAVVSARLVSLSLDEGEYASTIRAAVAFTNTGKEGIRAFDGELVFSDILGNEILTASVVVTDPLKAGEDTVWFGEIGYNKYKASHKKLAHEGVENLKMQFVQKKVLFTDGRGIGP